MKTSATTHQKSDTTSDTLARVSAHFFQVDWKEGQWGGGGGLRGRVTKAGTTMGRRESCVRSRLRLLRLEC